jgi:hypothetical protein
MYGAHINGLNVLIKTGPHNTTLWSKKGARGDKWIEAKVTITSRDFFKV